MNIFTVNNNSLISSYKTLNFYDNLPELVLSGEKTTTWRINDDKDIKKGDIIVCTRSERINRVKQPFAKIEVRDVWEKAFSEINNKDLAGHEKFITKADMYDRYTTAYGKKISDDSVLKIITFKLLEVL